MFEKEFYRRISILFFSTVALSLIACLKRQEQSCVYGATTLGMKVNNAKKSLYRMSHTVQLSGYWV